MHNQASNALGAVASDRAMTRIDHDVETIKQMSNRVRMTTTRIVRHATTLGYYEPQPTPSTAGVSPVVTTLGDALRELDRELDNLSGALNLFD